ncbi:hypothetical protein ES706_05796 [subsurface metagenome]
MGPQCMAMSLTLLLKSLKRPSGGSGGCGGKQILEVFQLVVGLTSLEGKENPLLSQNKL